MIMLGAEKTNEIINELRDKKWKNGYNKAAPFFTRGLHSFLREEEFSLTLWP